MTPAITKDESYYQFLFENMLNGYAYHQMLYDDAGNPIDFIYLDTNHAFEELTTLKDVVGKKVTEVIPGIRTSNPELFDIYGRVASTGKPEKFETEIQSMGFWFSVSVYSPKKGYFITIFDNITEQKESLESLENINNLMINRELKMLELKEEIAKLKDELSKKGTS